MPRQTPQEQDCQPSGSYFARGAHAADAARKAGVDAAVSARRRGAGHIETLEQLGRDLGLSKERVRQVQSRPWRNCDGPRDRAGDGMSGQHRCRTSFALGKQGKRVVGCRSGWSSSGRDRAAWRRPCCWPAPASGHGPGASSHVGGRTSHDPGRRLPLRPRPDLLPLSARPRARFSPRSAATCATRSTMVRLDPQYHLVFGGGGELVATPDVAGMEQAIAALSPRDAAPLPPLPRRQPGQAGRVSALPGKLRSCGWRDLLRWPHRCKLLPLAAPLAVARSRTGAATSTIRGSGWRSRSSRSTSACRRSTARASSRSCRSWSTSTASITRSAAARRSPRRWPESPANWASTISLDEDVEEILFEGRRAVGVRTSAGIHRRRPGDQRRLRPRHDAAGARPPAAAAGPTGRSPASSSPARRSCSISASRAATTTLAHHTIYMAADYVRNLRRHRDAATSCRTTRRSTCRTPASPTRRWRRPGMSTLYVLAPVTHQHPNVDWTAKAPTVPHASCCGNSASSG